MPKLVIIGNPKTGDLSVFHNTHSSLWNKVTNNSKQNTLTNNNIHQSFKVVNFDVPGGHRQAVRGY
jgi:hypothetical protein